jgi:phage-related protein
MNRTITTYGDYFMDFYSELEESLQEKFDYVFELVRTLDIIPKRFFQHLEGTDGLFEIRVEFESNIYRTFCFFDAGHLVILLNAFQKKTQKTPKQELELAKKLKKQYFIDKKIDIENGKRNKVKK